MRNITRKEWIEALKSGKYQQGSNRLQSGPNTFCCLGVACAVAGIPTEKIVENNSTIDIEGLELGLDLKFGEIPTYTTNWLPRVLANANDEGKSFDQIADLLIFDSWIRGIEQHEA